MIIKFVPSLCHVSFLSYILYLFIHVLALPSLNPCLRADHVLRVCVVAVTMYCLTWCPCSESTLHRYEIHPYETLPVGPEFKTTLRVRSWKGLHQHELGWSGVGRVLSKGWGESL